jgi:hypothetical protein
MKSAVAAQTILFVCARPPEIRKSEEDGEDIASNNVFERQLLSIAEATM